ncbi:unnamed protein product, partial [Polarella glacialis]
VKSTARARARRCQRLAAPIPADASKTRKPPVKDGEAQGKASGGPPPKRPKPVFHPRDQVGVIPQLGFFDPLNQAPDGKLQKWRSMREGEIKHGRVAMLATVGLIVQHFIHRPDVQEIPLYYGKSSPFGIGALGIFYGPEGFLQLIGLAFFFVVMEFFVWTPDDFKEPGDYGNPLSIPLYTPEMRYNEITNGRAAMISAVVIIFTEFGTGKDAVQQLGF